MLADALALELHQLVQNRLEDAERAELSPAVLGRRMRNQEQVRVVEKRVDAEESHVGRHPPCHLHQAAEHVGDEVGGRLLPTRKAGTLVQEADQGREDGVGVRPAQNVHDELLCPAREHKHVVVLASPCLARREEQKLLHQPADGRLLHRAPDFRQRCKQLVPCVQRVLHCARSPVLQPARRAVSDDALQQGHD